VITGGLREPPVSPFQYITDHWDTLGPEVVTQLELPLIAVALAALVGIAMGVLGARDGRLDAVFTAVNSTLLTLPSFALFGILVFYVGTGNLAVVIGLALYSLLPVQRNTSAGIRAVRAEVVEAARGMGMSTVQILSRIELPLALPVILAGVRQALSSAVAICTIGAAYNSDNLGRPILAVLRSQNLTALTATVLLIVVIGLAADAILAGAQRLLSRGRITRVQAA
jgi:osmoprotectant transport system permease protein